LFQIQATSIPGTAGALGFLTSLNGENKVTALVEKWPDIGL
jgi:hypothetical protein